MIWDENYVLSEMPGREETALEVEFLMDALELDSSDRVLDVACGAGRHAEALAARGIPVVGVDASRSLLDIAQTRAQHGNPVYIEADMRVLPFRAAFEIALCLFASFGLFDEEGNRRALASMAETLKPDGILLIETWNPFAAAQLDGRRNWWRAGDRLYLARVEYDPIAGIARDHREILDRNGRIQDSWTRSTRFYTPSELTAMASATGLRPLRWFGDFDGSDVSSSSPRVIVAFEKERA